MAEIGIIGAGSWGTALAVLCVNNGHDVTVWSRTKRDHKKDSRLPGVEIPDAICFTTDLSEAMKGKGAVILAVPSPYIREVSGKMRPFTEKGQIIVNVSKGVEKVLCIPFPRLLRRKSLRRKPQFYQVPAMRKRW